ncbi:uncharacterized protein LOC130053026 [Ostrea edulis]|uniref:uncharacterized protein LOC130053026 n=1 Tax=Ostrea edulis TaxID=37623 RepID=UPI0024AF2AF3|nr:uncharacterized protein LOC130053026 [Ostrea edulis]XP_056015422.1 uncharacterized protein LOC130053026 [Ostrea edulis]
MLFIRIFDLKIRGREHFWSSDPVITIGNQNIISVPDALIYQAAKKLSSKEKVLSVVKVRKKHRLAEDSVSEGTVRNPEKITPDLNHLHSSVTGQHVSEMLSILSRSVFGINVIYGIIVQGTEVTIAFLSVGEEYYRNLKEGSLQKLSSVVKYSRPYNYPHKRERENLIKTFVDMGVLSDNLQ